MIARREHHRIFLTVIAVSVVVCLVAMGFIVYRNHINEGRCEVIYGPGSTWEGKDLCLLPPIHTRGLM